MKIVAITVGISLVSALSFAQTTSPVIPPGAGGSGTASPTVIPDSGISTAPAVIHPGNPDPAMTVRPPSVGITPVVPPPGTAGNNPTVVPK